MDRTDAPLLLLDGNQRSALAVTRALGRRGVKIVVAEHGGPGLAGVSRFCWKTAGIASPGDSIAAFRSDVSAAAAKYGCALIIPMTDASLAAVYAGGTCLSGVVGPAASVYAQATDKLTASRVADCLGLAVPEGVECGSAEQLSAAARDVGFPLVIKPSRSRYVDGDRICSTSVSPIGDAASLARALTQDWVGKIPCLVQRLIPGTGAGVFALYDADGPVAWFAHRRVREKPPAGGVSVLCESVEPAAGLRQSAASLLEALDWFGPAMVEFRIDPNGKPWFIEVNGRFWGSLQLAIDCGLDFPWLYYQLCLGNHVKPSVGYALGRRLRWELGDLDHALLQLRGKGTAASAVAKARTVAGFLNPFAGWPEVFRLGDPRPFVHELKTWLGGVCR